MAREYLGKYRNESMRLSNYDYGRGGKYYITICTNKMKHYFGEVIESASDNMEAEQTNPFSTSATISNKTLQNSLRNIINNFYLHIMKKIEIISSLQQNHQAFCDYIQSLSADDFMHQKKEKWTAGQQIDHIVKSVSPVALAFGLPRIAPRLLFGKSKRPSKTYEGVVEKYKLKLSKGGKASGRFVPKEVSLQQRYLLPKQVMYYTNELCKKIEKSSEEELDVYLLPHPLLGKMTFREMLYFTIYHVEHHHEITKRDLKG